MHNFTPEMSQFFGFEMPTYNSFGLLCTDAYIFAIKTIFDLLKR